MSPEAASGWQQTVGRHEKYIRRPFVCRSNAFRTKTPAR